MEEMTRETSIQAYHDAEHSGLLSRVRAELLYIIAYNGPMTANEAFRMMAHRHNEADHLNRVSRAGQFTRLTELREMDLIEELGTRVCTVTGRNVILWGMTGRKIRKYARPSKADRIKELEAEIEELRAEIKRLKRRLPQLEFTI